MLSQQHNSHSDKSKVLVFGAGNFGSCLADHLADSQHEVVVWSRSPEVVKSLNETHRNTEYLTDHVFPESLRAIGPEFPSPEVVRGMDVLLFAIPTEGVRQACDPTPVMLYVLKIYIQTNTVCFEAST